MEGRAWIRRLGLWLVAWADQGMDAGDIAREMEEAGWVIPVPRTIEIITHDWKQPFRIHLVQLGFKLVVVVPAGAFIEYFNLQASIAAQSGAFPDPTSGTGSAPGSRSG
jgi:hypothetical protein